MKIPVFVSCPTKLRPDQNQMRKQILSRLDHLAIEPRALGRTDYPTEFPLREVIVIANKCAGGVILGFQQASCKKVILKQGTDEEFALKGISYFPTPWNHIEAGILFGLRLPILIFREEGISGGVFDPGVTDVFVHKMPKPRITKEDSEALQEVFRKWHAKVSTRYYE